MTEPTRSPDNIHDATCWARTWRRGEISMDDGNGQRDMRDRCVAELRRQAQINTDCRGGAAYSLALNGIADIIAMFEPRAAADGLSERGA